MAVVKKPKKPKQTTKKPNTQKTPIIYRLYLLSPQLDTEILELGTPCLMFDPLLCPA